MFKNVKMLSSVMAIAALAVVGVVPAQAALPTGLEAGLEGVGTDIGLLMTEYWPLIITGITIGVLIRWAKRGGRAI